MTEPSLDVEILVHVAAPSLVSDDVLYRTLANAYLGFETAAAERTIIFASPEAPTIPIVEDEDRQQCQADVVFAENEQDVGWGLSFTGSHNLSFRSVCDNRSSPRLRSQTKAVREDEVSSAQHHGSPSAGQSSWHPPPSEISDSYPMPPRLQPFSSPSRILQHYATCSRGPISSSPSPSRRVDRPRSDVWGATTQSSLDASVSSLPLVVPQHVQVGSSFPAPSADDEESQPKGTSPISLALGTIVPVTPLAQVPPQQKQKLDNGIDTDTYWFVADSARIPSTDLSVSLATSSFRSESEPPPSKRPRTIPHSTTSSDAAAVLVRSSSDFTPILRNRPARPPTTPTPIRFSPGALEIVPPSPPVGVVDLEPADLISPKLADLARKLSTRYRATHRRPLEAFERGHWYVDCASWTPQVKADAWAFLSDYLSSGLAGWGVWCRRDAADGGASSSWLKLFCWGHVAKHMYLLLYLASGRQMKSTIARWKDAEGQVVVTVPAAAKNGQLD